jgi:hypothetical protein
MTVPLTHTSFLRKLKLSSNWWKRVLKLWQKKQSDKKGPKYLGVLTVTFVLNIPNSTKNPLAPVALHRSGVWEVQKKNGRLTFLYRQYVPPSPEGLPTQKTNINTFLKFLELKNIKYERCVAESTELRNTFIRYFPSVLSRIKVCLKFTISCAEHCCMRVGSPAWYFRRPMHLLRPWERLVYMNSVWISSLPPSRTLLRSVPYF